MKRIVRILAVGIFIGAGCSRAHPKRMPIGIAGVASVEPHSVSLGLNACHAQERRITVSETRSEVRIRVTAKYEKPGGVHAACMDGAVVHLRAPLGDRPVINAATGQVVVRREQPTAVSTSSSTVAVDDGCWRPPQDAPPSTIFGSVHTIPPRSEDLSYRVEAVEPAAVCPGGRLRISVSVTNNGRRTVQVAPSVVVSGPSINGYEYTDCCPSVRVASRQTRQSIGIYMVPLDSDVGTFRLGFRDGGTGDRRATFTVHR